MAETGARVVSRATSKVAYKGLEHVVEPTVIGVSNSFGFFANKTAELGVEAWVHASRCPRSAAQHVVDTAKSVAAHTETTVGDLYYHIKESVATVSREINRGVRGLNLPAALERPPQRDRLFGKVKKAAVDSTNDDSAAISTNDDSAAIIADFSETQFFCVVPQQQ